MDLVFLRPEYRSRPEYKIRPRQGKMGTPSGSKPVCGSAGWHGPATSHGGRQVRGLTEMVARWQAGGFLELPVEDTFAARGFGVTRSQIVSVDVATGARMEHTSGPALKNSPQSLIAVRFGFTAKAVLVDHGGQAFPTVSPET